MKESEAAIVLSLCATFDQRTIGRADATAWARVLDDVNLRDALEAVDAWYGSTRDRIMPADIRNGVRKIRALRLQKHGDPVIAVDPDDTEAYKAEIARARQAIADGETWPEPALSLTARPTAALEIGRQVPYDDPARVERRAELRKAAHAKREEAERNTAIAAEIRQKRAEAQAEVERVRAEMARKQASGE